MMVRSLVDCKRPLLAITGACALGMRSTMAFTARAASNHGSRNFGQTQGFAISSTIWTSAFATSRRVSVHADASSVVSRSTLRRRIASTKITMSSSSGSDGDPKKIVFLGTPDLAAISLELLLQASREGPHAGLFEIVRAVSNPPTRAGRRKVTTPSSVHTLAAAEKIPVMTPTTGRDESFLTELEELEPDLCVTAAYGQFLPQRFLDIPKFGTLNVHPSLLPKYRGASPVQRCLEAGDTETGVSVAFTVLKMDAGPIVRQTVRQLDGTEKAPELLRELFREGTQELVDALPSVFDGSVTTMLQDESAAIKAAKISPEEARCCFKTSTAKAIHNKVRGFAGWPGTHAMFSWGEGKGSEPTRIKLITTEIGEPQPFRPSNEVVFRRNALEVTCGDGSMIRLLEVQPVYKNVMSAKAFVNGLRGESLSWVEYDPVEETAAA